jgi:L-amino acid N-acyltransferase YncA
MRIREITDDDWPQVWDIVREVMRAEETFVYDPAMTEEQARVVWLEPPPGRTVVALDGGRVVGTAKMGPNRPGPGKHVSTASFMVAADCRGRGAGRALCGGRPGRVSRACSSTRWSRPTGPPSTSTVGSASG